ncbi:MAG: two-component regulator propeller domain-containing protein [Fidelibacterota bacterium]
MKKLTILLVALALMSLPFMSCDGDDNKDEVKEPVYTVFNNTNSDLPYNAVYCIDFDNNGNIWFGGQKDAATGVANVSKLSNDLASWTVYNADDIGLGNMEDRVFYMAVDNQNTKWFCTHYGVGYLKADGTSGEVDTCFNDYTRSVQTDSDGNIYISDRTVKGIYVSTDHGANWTLWTADDINLSTGRPEIYDLKEDSQGRMWICTFYGVVYRTGTTWTEVSALSGEYTFALTLDPDDNAWVTDAGNNNLYKITGSTVAATYDSTDIEPLKYPMNDLEADKYGNIWCALSGGGLLKILPDMTFEQFTTESTGGALPEDVLIELEIYDDVIWIATETEGIVMIENLIQL